MSYCSILGRSKALLRSIFLLEWHLCPNPINRWRFNIRTREDIYTVFPAARDRGLQENSFITRTGKMLINMKVGKND